MKKSLFKKITTAVFPFLMWTTQITSASGTIQDSNYAKGTIAIINDTTLALTIILPISCALLIAYQSLRKKWSDGDGGVHSDAAKKIKGALIITVIGTTATGLVTLITGYYV